MIRKFYDMADPHKHGSSTPNAVQVVRDVDTILNDVLEETNQTLFSAQRQIVSIVAKRYHAQFLSPSMPVGSEKSFQNRVNNWMMECFSMQICRDTVERNHRFLEEALELVQSLGCTQSEAMQLVDYVFSREVGEPTQEVGGVVVTLAALCLANDFDMMQCGETELARIWTKIDKIREKQASKPKHSPLPQNSDSFPTAQQLDFGLITDQIIEWRLKCGRGGWYNIQRDELSQFIKERIAMQILQYRNQHPVSSPVQELLKKCKHALGILSTMCGVADLPEGKIVANKILKELIDYLPKGNIEDVLRSNGANDAIMMQSETAPQSSPVKVVVDEKTLQEMAEKEFPIADCPNELHDGDKEIIMRNNAVNWENRKAFIAGAKTLQSLLPSDSKGSVSASAGDIWDGGYNRCNFEIYPERFNEEQPDKETFINNLLTIKK